MTNNNNHGDTLSRTFAKAQVENEWAFCASAFTSPDIALRECAWLDPSVFIHKELSNFWKSVLKDGNAIKAAQDTNTVTELMKWQTKVPTTIKPEDYARGIAEANYYQRVIQGVLDVGKKAKEKDFAEIQNVLSRMLEDKPFRSSSVYTATDIDLEFRQALNSKMMCVQTYVRDLDKSVGGLFAKELSILAGRPAMGKSAVAMHVARNVANSKNTVLFFSLEMSRLQLWARMACGNLNISWRDVRAGKISAVDRQSIEAESKKLEVAYRNHLLIQDEVYTVGEMYQIASQHKPKLVVVDYLDEVHWDDNREERLQWYGKAVKFLRHYIARKLDCHVMIIHQLSREVEGRDDKRPILKDLKYSGDLEAIADVVLMAYRNDYYQEGGAVGHISDFELIVRKNRQGPLDVVHLIYDRQKQWFDPINASPIPF